MLYPVWVETSKAYMRSFRVMCLVGYGDDLAFTPVVVLSFRRITLSISLYKELRSLVLRDCFL